MKRILRMAAMSLAATGVAFGTAAASPAMAAASPSQANSSCILGTFVKKDGNETIIVARMTWCASGDIVKVNDLAYDGRSMGVRVDDGSGKYRWCKDVNGGDNKAKSCNFDLKENRTIKFRGYQAKKGHSTIWLNTHKFSN